MDANGKNRHFILNKKNRYLEKMKWQKKQLLHVLFIKEITLEPKILTFIKKVWLNNWKA